MSEIDRRLEMYKNNLFLLHSRLKLLGTRNVDAREDFSRIHTLHACYFIKMSPKDGEPCGSQK